MARLHRKVCTRCVISFGIIASQVAVRRHHPVFQAEKKRHDVFTSHMVRQAFGPSMARPTPGARADEVGIEGSIAAKAVVKGQHLSTADLPL